MENKILIWLLKNVKILKFFYFYILYSNFLRGRKWIRFLLINYIYCNGIIRNIIKNNKEKKLLIEIIFSYRIDLYRIIDKKKICIE